MMGFTSNTLPKLAILKKGQRISATQWNALAGLINGARAQGGIRLTMSPGGMIIGGGGGGSSFPWSKLAFGYSLAGSICTIYPGKVRVAGIGEYTLGQSNITLSASTEWVYVQYTRGTTGGSLTPLSSGLEPESNSSTVKIPLYRFDLVNGSYVLGLICNMGDIHLDTPIR